MLDTHSYKAQKPHRVPQDDAAEHILQIAAEARRHRQAVAESLAGRGTFEINLNLHGEEAGYDWSPGIYALLYRDQDTGPLPRAEYIRRYVAVDDQQRILAASSAAFTERCDATLRYRIIAGDGAMLDVSEQLSLITPTGTGNLFYGDLALAHAPATLLKPQVNPAFLPAMRAMLATLDALKDGEQHRLQREMHDEFGQLLAAMKLDLSLLQKKLTRCSASVQRQIDSLHELIDTMIVSVRRIVAELPPQVIAELGLTSALEHLAQGFRKRFHVKILLSCKPEVGAPNAFLALSAYRITQEALSNIVRHAEADCVRIVAIQQGRKFRLRIEDNGKGITEADLKKPGSFGMMWMRERVTTLEGTIDIKGRAGAGTVIDIQIPAGPATD